jgi:hypothetical protein
MERYPSIEGSKYAPIGEWCYAFKKYDGSNLRFEWTPKKGWHKFGTRRELFDQTSPVYSPAIPIFMDTMADYIVQQVKAVYKNIQRITAFAEYFGPNSFAGQHRQTDPKELRLIDVYLYKRGMITPIDFIDLFQFPYAAELLYTGPLTTEFIQEVREGKLPVTEGVVAKGDHFRVKIKTLAYLAKLKETYGNSYEQHWE